MHGKRAAGDAPLTRFPVGDVFNLQRRCPVPSPDPEVLFALYRRQVYRFLARMTGRRDVADDLCQEVFVRVVRSLQRGTVPDHDRGWVFTIARNLLVDYRRAVRGTAGAEAAGSPKAGHTQTAGGIRVTGESLFRGSRFTLLVTTRRD